MDWFLKLDQTVQIWVLAVGGVVVISLTGQLFGFFRAWICPPPTPATPDDWFLEYVKRMPKVNDGPFHTAHYTVETKVTPKPPKGGSGTAPPKLTVTRYYVRRDDGMFFSTGMERWGPKASATHWGRVEDARKCCSELMAQGAHDVRVVDMEVEA